MATAIRETEELGVRLPRLAARSGRSLHEILNSVRASKPVELTDALSERGSGEETATPAPSNR
jgi:hypothetical protein